MRVQCSKMEVEFKIKLHRKEDIKELAKLLDKWISEEKRKRKEEEEVW